MEFLITYIYCFFIAELVTIGPLSLLIISNGPFILLPSVIAFANER